MGQIKIQGGALLTALFTMTLIAIVATAMSVRLQTDIYRTRLVIMQDKLLMATQEVTFWAMEELSNNNNQFTQLDKQGCVRQFPKNKDATFELTGELYDLQGRFNINNLANPKMIFSFLNLINQSTSNQDSALHLDIARATSDWVSPYQLEKGLDEYTAYYLSQKPPYFASHELMNHVSEFRLVKGVDSKRYQILEPYLTALPEITTININTAPKQVLMTLGNGLNEPQVDELRMAVGKKGISSFQTINDLIKKLGLAPSQMTLESQYFLCIAHAVHEEFKVTVYTVLKRKRNGNASPKVSLLYQTINGSGV